MTAVVTASSNDATPAPVEIFESPAMMLRRQQGAIQAEARAAVESLFVRVQALANEAAALGSLDLYNRSLREGLDQMASNMLGAVDRLKPHNINK